MYDYLSLKDAIREACDVILICGYTTAAVSLLLLNPKKSNIITNIDGLEWKRSKHSLLVQHLTRWFEKIAVKRSAEVISDNIGIQEYVTKNYNRDSYFIPYAAEVFSDFDEQLLSSLGLIKNEYFLLIGRLEPENNIEMILDGIAEARDDTPVHIFASIENKYAKYLINKFKSHSRIKFRGWLGGQRKLASLRKGAKIYFHGHSVGGTNPSLLEAMAAGAFIAAHDNIFNKYVLKENALYFSSSNEVKELVETLNTDLSKRNDFTKNNLKQIHDFYTWDNITSMYENLFKAQLLKRSNGIPVSENHRNNSQVNDLEVKEQ